MNLIFLHWESIPENLFLFQLFFFKYQFFVLKHYCQKNYMYNYCDLGWTKFIFRMSDASDSGSSLNSGDESLSDNDQDWAWNFFWRGTLTLIREFLGLSPSVISEKKIQSTEIYTNDAMTALWIFFPKNTLGHGPAFRIVFLGFTDKG